MKASSTGLGCMTSSSNAGLDYDLQMTPTEHDCEIAGHPLALDVVVFFHKYKRMLDCRGKKGQLYNH